MTLPSRFVDVSQFREIPDNQEVYSDPSTDQSVIVEILEMAQESHGPNAVLLHFNELGDMNEASSRNVVGVEAIPSVDMPNFDSRVERYALFGSQTVAKHNEQFQNLVNIYMALVRVPTPVHADILVTFNDSVLVDPHSSVASYKQGHPTAEDNLATFKALLASLAVRDWAIFQ